VETTMTAPYVRPMSPLLKMALDLGPLLIFFAANTVAGIFTATAVFMVAIMLSIGIGFAIERKVSPMSLLTCALVLIFGGLTLWLSNENFIKIKPTILYSTFAAVLVGGLAFNRLFIKYLLGQTMHLAEPAWRSLTWRWSVFFLALAIVNEFVWRNTTTDTWVAFKVWGVLPLTLLFALSQTPFIARHQVEGDKSPPAV
jgi:intracellular septation protein